MPLIEVLPNSTAATAPGWAYVPDTGYDPSKAAIVPSGSRKRATRNLPVAASGDLSARQQSKLTRHLTELDKENHKDVQIIVPDKPRDVAKRGLRAQMTPGVRKILLSQKTFANHLADEEAALSTQSSTSVVPKQPHNLAPDMSSSQSRVKRASMTQTDVGHDDVEAAQHFSSAADSDALATFSDPLLESNVPDLPSLEEMESILSLSPLSYMAARATPTKSSTPANTFCDMCGYWGRARCMKCGAPVCGLVCKSQHDETTCQKFYA